MLRDGSFEGSQDGGNNVQGDAARCERVHRKLKRIVGARGKLDAEEAAALREALKLRIWRTYGYASLVEYMEREMGYSPRAAIERLRVAKAIEELPLIANQLSQGDIPFSAAREITRVVTPQTEHEWVEASQGKNLRQVEELVSGHKPGDRPSDPPDPKLVDKFLRFKVKPETAALERQAKKILEKERGMRLDDDGFLAALFRQVIDGAAPTERTRAPYQVAVTVCEQCKRGWQDGAGAVVEMSPPSIERALCDAQHIGSLEGNDTPRATQTIPPATRRKVLRRDHDKCRVPWCRSSRNLDLHHLVPRARGGTHEVDGIVTLCEAHHLAHHEGSLAITGTSSNLKFERSPNHGFKIATRMVETTKALRGLGWKPHEAKAAVEATRTHVGTADLTLEQWIKLALSKCPKPG